MKNQRLNIIYWTYIAIILIMLGTVIWEKTHKTEYPIRIYDQETVDTCERLPIIS